jgi:hypothetical protein
VGLCCVALPNVPRSLSVILTQPLTGVSQRSTYLSHQLETPQFCACLCIKTLIAKYGSSSPLCRLFFCSFLGVLCFASKAVRDKWVISSTDSELGRFASRASNRKPQQRVPWAAMAMSLAGFLCRCDLLIRPKKEKDYVDPSSLPAPGNNHAAMDTSWCRSGASACGLLALVYHSTTPETGQGGTERYPSPVAALYLSGSLSGRLCSKYGRPSVRVRTYLHHRGVDGLFSPV